MKAETQIAEQERFISTSEAANRLGVALRTAQLWVESGRLTAWKTVGGHRRITVQSVNALLAERQAALSRSDDARLQHGVDARKDVLDLLIVEDDAALMRLYAYHVESWGLPIRLHRAQDGFEGLRLLGEHHPEILITDLSMPGIDGFRMLRSVAAWEDFQEMTTIVVTALSPEDVEDRGGLPARVRLFTKPAPFALLGQIVRERAALAMQALMPG